MLTRMRFKNWRSLKDVEINDLTPITVFIGANSSGKTNIIDALSFLRRMLRENVPDSTYFQVNREAQIRTLGVSDNEPIELEIGFLFEKEGINPAYKLVISTDGKQTIFHDRVYVDDTAATSIIYDAEMTLWGKPAGTPMSLVLPEYATFGRKSDVSDSDFYNPVFSLYAFLAYRWQILGEGFDPARRSFRGDSVKFDTFTIDEKALDLPILLSFMKERHHDLYTELQGDMRWFMKHIAHVDVREESSETRIVIQEIEHENIDAPTISAGSGRALAMLTANYLLSMRYAEIPGLVVIEEPDTALNPGLLQRFVEQLRVYASGPHPRQFILTTHNPTFLNYFKPEEVRVVSRDEQGYTHVERIPEYVSEIWLDKHSLGDAWLTNSLGGFAE